MAICALDPGKVGLALVDGYFYLQTACWSHLLLELGRMDVPRGEAFGWVILLFVMCAALATFYPCIFVAPFCGTPTRFLEACVCLRLCL